MISTSPPALKTLCEKDFRPKHYDPSIYPSKIKNFLSPLLQCFWLFLNPILINSWWILLVDFLLVGLKILRGIFLLSHDFLIQNVVFSSKALKSAFFVAIWIFNRHFQTIWTDFFLTSPKHSTTWKIAVVEHFFLCSLRSYQVASIADLLVAGKYYSIMWHKSENNQSSALGPRHSELVLWWNKGRHNEHFYVSFVKTTNNIAISIFWTHDLHMFPNRNWTNKGGPCKKLGETNITKSLDI